MPRAAAIIAESVTSRAGRASAREVGAATRATCRRRASTTATARANARTASAYVQSGTFGDYCEKSLCPDNCSGHGSCNQLTGTCQCDPGYEGSPSCSGHKPCPHDCSQNGLCSDGMCTCYGGFMGLDCSQKSCGVTNCNHATGNGYCNTRTGTCSCKYGYTGADCSIKTCSPADCSGNGKCEGGECICRPGWSGSSCDIMDGCAGGCGGPPRGECEPHTVRLLPFHPQQSSYGLELVERFKTTSPSSISSSSTIKLCTCREGSQGRIAPYARATRARAAGSTATARRDRKVRLRRRMVGCQMRRTGMPTRLLSSRHLYAGHWKMCMRIRPARRGV